MTSTNHANGIPHSNDLFDYTMAFAPPATSARWKIEPTVFLFGWTGCQDRYLVRYAAMYQKLGCTSVRYTAPTKLIFFRSMDAMDEIGGKVEDFFNEMEMAGQPYFIHMFSGGGCLVYNAWRKCIKRVRGWGTDLPGENTQLGNGSRNNGSPATPDTRKLCGLIFDCCPARSSPLERARAYCDIFVSPSCRYSAFRFPLRLLFAVTFVFMDWMKWFFGGIQKALPWGPASKSTPASHERRPLSYYETLQQDTEITCPKLFLYTHADVICKSHSIEAYMEHEKSRGVKVSAKAWNDLPHCQLYRLDPDAYEEAVREFVDEAAEQYLNK